jgi:hypothetical protein
MGNMPCDDDEECVTWRLHTPRQAKLLCDAYFDKCKGFVFTSSHEVYFKSDVKGKFIPHPGQTLYIKKAHAQGIDIPLEVCAVEVDYKLFSDFSEGCKLAEFNPFDKTIMQFIKKPEPLECKGEQKTLYRNGVIEFIPSKEKGILK